MNLTDILSELGRAKEAMDALPDARRKIDELEVWLQSKNNEIERLNTSLADTQSKLSQTSEKLASVEEERDQYGFRAMEADEKLEKVLELVGPKVVPPQPTSLGSGEYKEAKYVREPLVQASEPITQASYADAHPQPFVPVNPDHYAYHSGTDNEADVSVGQSVSHPTSSANITEPNATPHSATNTDVSPGTGPYAGRKYYDKPENISWHDWTQGGGEAAPWMS